MKISNSKKELARIISENGGWRNGKFAAQDSDGGVGGYDVRPEWDSLAKYWWREALGKWFLADKIKNHHQTVLFRAEYFHLYPAPGADGWIEHDGKHEPAVATSGLTLWCKWSDGLEQSHEANMVDWIDDSDVRIIAYRLHKPEIATSAREPKPVPVPEAKPTIEQLAADYRNAKDYFERKQQEADAAKADVEAKLAELVAAGKALGLVLSVAVVEPELVIHDWQDLQVGDIIECIGSWEREDTDGHRFAVTAIDPRKAHVGKPIRIEVPEVSCPGTWGLDFKFIRRQ